LKVGGGYFGVTGSGYSSCYLWLFWLGDFDLQLGGVRSAVGDSEGRSIGQADVSQVPLWLLKKLRF
jgi:hypothetical protein